MFDLRRRAKSIIAMPLIWKSNYSYQEFLFTLSAEIQSHIQSCTYTNTHRYHILFLTKKHELYPQTTCTEPSFQTHPSHKQIHTCAKHIHTHEHTDKNISLIHTHTHTHTHIRTNHIKTFPGLIQWNRYRRIPRNTYEEFHRKTGWIHFGQFDIFEI